MEYQLFSQGKEIPYRTSEIASAIAEEATRYAGDVALGFLCWRSFASG
jgi:hypothetical protein